MKKNNQNRCNRISIAAGDVAFITGVHLRSAQRLLVKIRKVVGKRKDDFVTIAEFCAFTGFIEQEIFKILNNL